MSDQATKIGHALDVLGSCHVVGGKRARKLHRRALAVLDTLAPRRQKAAT